MAARGKLAAADVESAAASRPVALFVGASSEPAATRPFPFGAASLRRPSPGTEAEWEEDAAGGDGTSVSSSSATFSAAVSNDDVKISYGTDTQRTHVCTYGVHIVYIQCTYSVRTVYIQCTYCVHTVHPCVAYTRVIDLYSA